MAGKERKAEHSGAKKGSGVYWGRKADAKRESTKKRRAATKTEIVGLISANREAWNEVASRHRDAAWNRTAKAFHDPKYRSLDSTETAHLEQIGVRKKAIAHLCCNSGVELISIARMGAARCVGFDISSEFIAQARELSQKAGAKLCQFIEVDIHAIPETFNANFDLIYLSAGTLGWMPNLRDFFKVARRLLKPSGQMYIYEMHPILGMFGVSREEGTKLLRSYFQTEPIVESGLDYLGKTQYEGKPTYWFHHKLSDVFASLLELGFKILTFEELPHDVSGELEHLEQLSPRLPLSFCLVAELTSQESGNLKRRVGNHKTAF